VALQLSTSIVHFDILFILKNKETDIQINILILYVC